MEGWNSRFGSRFPIPLLLKLTTRLAVDNVGVIRIAVGFDGWGWYCKPFSIYNRRLQTARGQWQGSWGGDAWSLFLLENERNLETVSMRLFQASCLASAFGGAIAGSASCFSLGLAWMLGGFLMGGFAGVLCFLLIIGIAYLLSLSTGSNGMDGAAAEMNHFQHAIVGITLGLTVLAPFLSIAASMGLMAFLRQLFA